MRILFINHVPAVRELGAGRVQLELGEELVRSGHEVDFFTPEADDRRAFRVGPLSWPRFAPLVHRHVRAVGHRYDVIEAHQGLVTRTKADLGFNGVIAVRSSGLVASYRRAERLFFPRLPAEARGRLAGRALRALTWHLDERAASRSFDVADVIHVPNADEKALLDEEGLAHKVEVIPNALSEGTLEALAAVAHGPRPDPPVVVFIASWTGRKGVYDWPEILEAAWGETSDLRFHFAGTGADEATVRRDLRIGDDRRIEVTPRFPAEALPAVLAKATVGALPSYIEGFGLGVLETLAAGRPCVTYDVPGPRSLAGAVRQDWLTPVAQPALFGRRLAEVAAEERVHPDRYAEECVSFARNYNWRAIAEATLALYGRARS